MSNTAQSLASTRIASLLDENSFVEIGGQVTARSTDFNMAGMETPSDGVITGYGVINGSRWKSGIRIQPGCVCDGRYYRRNACKKNRETV